MELSKMNKKALELSNEGFTIIPTRKDENGKAKIPIGKSWTTATPATTNEILSWSNDGIGLLTGKDHGILVIDIDEVDGSRGCTESLAREMLGNTRIERTVSNGYHGFYKGKFDIVTKAGCIYDFKGHKVKLDVLYDRRQCVISPTPGYEIINDVPMSESVPKWVYTLSSKDMSKEELITMFNHGTRDHTIFELAKFCRDRGRSKEDTYDTCITAGAACKPPVSEAICMAKVDSAFTHKSTSDIYWDLIMSRKGSSRRISRKDMETLTDLNKTTLSEKIDIWLEQGKLARVNKHGEFVIVENKRERMGMPEKPVSWLDIKFPFYAEHIIGRLPSGSSSLWAAVKNGGKTTAAWYFMMANWDFDGRLVCFRLSETGDKEWVVALEEVANAFGHTAKEALERIEVYGYPEDGLFDLEDFGRALIVIDHIIDTTTSYMVGKIMEDINAAASKIDGHVMVTTQAHGVDESEKKVNFRTYGGESGFMAARYGFQFSKHLLKIVKCKRPYIGVDGRRYDVDDTVVRFNRSETSIGWNIDSVDINDMPSTLVSKILTKMRSSIVVPNVKKRSENRYQRMQPVLETVVDDDDTFVPED